MPDVKITDLLAGATPVDTDLLETSQDIPGTPVSRKISFSQIKTYLDLGTLASQDADNVNISGGAAILNSLQAPFQYIGVVGDISLATNNSLGVFDCDTASGAITIEDDQGLANYADGMTFCIKNRGTVNSVIFQPFSGQTIDGLASLTVLPGEGFFITKATDRWLAIANLGTPATSGPWTLVGANSVQGPGTALVYPAATNSLAFGANARAGTAAQSYSNAVAIGSNAIAGWDYSTAIGGDGSQANAPYSMALNGGVADHEYSFVIGDNDPNKNHSPSTDTGQFVGSFFGGYHFYISDVWLFKAVDINPQGVLQAYKGFRMYNPAGTFYAGLNAGAMSADVSWTLPLADGTAGQVLQTNGSGALSFTSVKVPPVIVTGSSAWLAVNTDYIVQAAASTYTNLTLPGAAAVGDKLTIINDTTNASTGFVILLSPGQQIFFGNQASTVGAGGRLTLDDPALVNSQHSAVTLVCTVANTTWTVTSSVGAFSVQ